MFDRDGKAWLNDRQLTKAYIVYTPSIWKDGSTAWYQLTCEML